MRALFARRARSARYADRVTSAFLSWSSPHNFIILHSEGARSKNRTDVFRQFVSKRFVTSARCILSRSIAEFCPLAGFGGLFASGLISGLDGKAGLAGWRWLCEFRLKWPTTRDVQLTWFFTVIIEGVVRSFPSIITIIMPWLILLWFQMTTVIGMACYVLLPSVPSKTLWLTEEQRRLAIWRSKLDASGSEDEADDMTRLEAVKLIFMDWKVSGCDFFFRRPLRADVGLPVQVLLLILQQTFISCSQVGFICSGFTATSIAR